MSNQSSSSDESDLPNLAVTKSNFRVRVSLQRFYTDIRSRCFVLVSRHKRVRWLEQRLRKLFAIKGHFCLRSYGHLLPSSEPLALLNPDDEIEVIPRELSEDAVDVDMTNHNQSNLNITPIERKGLKNCNIKLINGFEAEQVIDKEICGEEHKLEGEMKPHQQEHVFESVRKPNNFNFVVEDREKLRDKKKEALALLQEQFGETQNEICNRVDSRRKRKRIRHRRRPQTNDSVQEISSPLESAANFQVSFVPSDTIADSSSSAILAIHTSGHAEINTNINTYISTKSELQLACASDSEHVIARNNAIEPRKPRVIYALDNL